MGRWKDGAQIAVMLTFDFDAETLWISRDPANAKRAGTLSMGAFGARVGVPLILDMLREYDLHATFFIPGWVAENWTAEAQQIRDAGHEIGHHGYLHEWVDPDYPEREEEVLVKGLEALDRVLGVRPIGYRSPAWETSVNTLRLLEKYGLFYSSSFLDDLLPYRHVVDGRTSRIVELPVSWTLDDAPWFLFSVRAPVRNIFPSTTVEEVWREEFHGIYQFGGLFNLTMHPQLIGRPARLQMLRRFLEYVLGFPGVWVATGSEIAGWWAEHDASAAPGAGGVGDATRPCR